MRPLFYLIAAIILTQSLTSEGFCAAPNLEEQKVNIPNNKKIKSVEELTAELADQEAAAQPFNEKDIKVDVESLGLDSLDDNKKSTTTNKTADAKPTSALPEKFPVPIPTQPVQATTGESNAVNIKGSVDEKKDDGEVRIFSKIQNFINKTVDKTIGDKILPELVTDPETTENLIDKKAEERKLRAEKKAQLRKRVAEEKRRAAAKREVLRKEAKMIHLNKLREEYLIKLHEPSDEEKKDGEFAAENMLITPQEKSFGWSSRFISDEPPALPILDPYRAGDNKHIPTIATTQERIDTMFRAISEKNYDIAYFNSAYQYVLDPNIRNASGDSILTYATLLQKYSIMSSILAKGADPDLPNALGHTAFDIAIEMLDIKSAKILITMNADINYVDGIGRTYLMHAARTGFLPMVDLLVSQGSDVDATDNAGLTALAIAYRHKKEVIAKFLIKNGAKPWIKKPYNPDNQNLIKELENRWKK